jgi:signal transduction histidine kinase
VQRISIRWLLLGVSAAALLVPVLALVALRWYTGYLVRRTEEQLLAQSVLVAEAFRDAYRREIGGSVGATEIAGAAAARYAPLPLLAERISELSPPEPAELPHAKPEQLASPAYRAGVAIEPLLRRAQVHNLSAIRVLDAGGCVVATTRGDARRCLTSLPEVEGARRGRYSAVIRARVSDEPPPPLASISRRGDRRLFLALPVLEDGKLIAVVRASRTAESGLEWIWKNRLPFLGGVLLVLTAALALSLACASLIARPLERMARATSDVAASGAIFPADVAGRAPRELAVLGAALSTMTEKLAARARYVAEFAANVSHELKTPLTSMRGAAELLREQWSDMQPAQRDRFLANIQADAERTETLVRGLLQLARIEHPAHPVDVASVRLGDLQRELLLRYPEHVHVQSSEPDAEVAIPLEHLHSALGNLIDNALRYRRVRPVQVRLARDGTRLVAEVEDDGPGISPANQPRIFDRFFTTERDRGGTGLGLAIVKAIAHARGGTVSHADGAGGTRFRLVL